MKYIFLPMIAAVLLLAACGTPETPANQAQPQPSPSITPTPDPNITPTLSPTLTPIPAECTIVELTPTPNTIPPTPGPGETIISSDGWQRVVCPTRTPTVLATARQAPAARATVAPVVAGSAPCPDRFAQGEITPTPTPPERMDIGADTPTCLPQPQAEPTAASPCPPVSDDHPPALPQPTRVGQPAVCATSAPAEATSSVSNPASVQGQRMIGLPSQNQTVELQVGETFELRLTGDMEWDVQIGDERVVARVPGQPAAGSQGVFKALAPGSAALTAIGEPLCRKATPACMTPSFQFSVTIAVRG